MIKRKTHRKSNPTRKSNRTRKSNPTRKSKTRRSRKYKKIRGGGITSTNEVRRRRPLLTEMAIIEAENARVAAIVAEAQARRAEIDAQLEAARQEREAEEEAEEEAAAVAAAAAEEYRVKRCKKNDTLFKKNGIYCGDKFNYWQLMFNETNKNRYKPIELTVTDMKIVNSFDGTRKIHRIFFEETDGGDYELEFPQFELYIKRFLINSERFPQLQLIPSKKSKRKLFSSNSTKKLLNPLITESGEPFEDHDDDFDSRYKGTIPAEYKGTLPREYTSAISNSTTVG